MPVIPDVRPFYDEPTGTFSYVVSDPVARKCAIVDPVLDYEARAGRTGTVAADAIAEYVKSAGLEIEWILETHAHADHLSAAQYLKSALGGRLAIGAGIRSVQAHFAKVFNFEPAFSADGSQFDHLFEADEQFTIGRLEARVLATPGHTNDSVTYLIGDAAFVGDTVFMPDSGTARCDFPGGDAVLLHESIQKLYALPAETRIFVCHDYAPGGREPRCETTVAEQRNANIHVRADTPAEEFVAMREARDATLALPDLIVPSVQVNIRAGHLPPAEDNGLRYLKTPIDVLGRSR
ncbi:MAG TPA: MBL fold metallo-hydrolase [Steroidobacteraceae bacterium]|nr:MBL fold metallo-hydrolase [Steroidobacteraceae bacterium]